MKKFYLAIFLLFGLIMFAQQSNKRDVLHLTNVEAFLESPATSLKIATYDDGREYEKKLILKAVTNGCKAVQGLKILLNNGEVIFLESATAQCLKKGNVSYSIAEIDVTNNRSLYDKLKKHEIKSYQIGENTIPVTFKEKGENLKLMLQFSEEK